MKTAGISTALAPGAHPASAYREDIEGLRGLAILLVIAFHVGVPGLTGGYIGVDVFFVVSGYLITGLIAAEIEHTGRLSLLQFYARRTRRLLPAAALVLAVTLVLAAVVYSPIEMQQLARTAQSVALYLSNVRFAWASVDYLGSDSSPDAFLHTWSLGVEEQFYVVWPLLVAVLMWAGARMLGVRRMLIAGMLAVTLGTFVLCVYLTHEVQPWAFYLSPPRFWEFGVGGLATILPLRACRPAVTRWSAAICMTLVLVPALAFNAHTQFPGLPAAVPVLGTAGLLRAAAAAPNGLVIGALTRPSMLWFGRHSYAWYLWHWPLLVLSAVVWPHPSLIVRLGTGLVALACSVVTYKWLEAPVRMSRSLRARPRVSIALGFGLALLGLGCGQLLHRYAGRLLKRPAQERFAHAKRDVPLIYVQGCTSEFLEVAPKRACVFGDVDSSQTVVLFGDSHAAQWFPAIDVVAREKHWRLIVKVKDACPPPSLRALYSERLRRVYSECSRWRQETLAEIIAMRPVLTIMSSATSYIGEADDPERVTTDEWKRGSGETISALEQAHVRQLWIADTPRPGFSVPECLSRADVGLVGGGDCTFERATGFLPHARDLQSAVIARSQGRLLDLTDQICPGPRCVVERDGIVMYSDSNHLSASFVASLAKTLLQRLDD